MLQENLGCREPWRERNPPSKPSTVSNSCPLSFCLTDDILRWTCVFVKDNEPNILGLDMENGFDFVSFEESKLFPLKDRGVLCGQINWYFVSSKVQESDQGFWGCDTMGYLSARFSQIIPVSLSQQALDAYVLLQGQVPGQVRLNLKTSSAESPGHARTK